MPAIRNESTSKATRSDPTGQTRSRGGDKSVTCDVCGKVLNRKPDLNRHMQTHSKEARRFKCPYTDCPFDALQRSNLNTHLATHTKEKNHACPDCNYTTSDPAALTRHRKRQHKYVPKIRRKMPKNNKGKAPEVQAQSSTCLEQQLVATQQPIAGPSTTLVPAIFSDYGSSPSPSPSGSGSERCDSSELYDYDAAGAGGYSAYGSRAGSVETGTDYYPSPLNSDDEAASVGGSRGGTPSSVSSASYSGSSSPSREPSVGVGASSVGSRSASIPPPLPLQAQAGPSSGIVLMRTNPNSHDYIKEEEVNVDWLVRAPQQPQDQAGPSGSGAGNFDFTQYLNTSNDNLSQPAGAGAGMEEDTTNSVWCVGAQPWMPGMSQTDGLTFYAQDPYQFESNLSLPTNATSGGCVPNIGGLPWGSDSSIYEFGSSSYLDFDPMPSPFNSIPTQSPASPVFGDVKTQQQQYQQQVYSTPSPSPSSSRDMTPSFEYQEMFGSSNESWFLGFSA